MQSVKLVIKFLFLLLLIIVGLGVRVEVAWADNMIKNPGFESGMSEWSNTQQGGSEIVGNEKKSGEKSILVKNANSHGSYGVEQTLTGIKEGKNYLIEGWAKRVDEKTVDRIRMRIAWYDCDNADCGQMSTNDSNQVETDQWSYLRMEIMAPDKAKSAKVRLILMAKENGVEGKAYFDEIKMDRYEPEPTATPSPTPAPTSTPRPTDNPDMLTPTHTPKLTPTVKDVKQISLNDLDEADNQQAVTGVDELRQKIKGYDVEATATNSSELSSENSSDKKLDLLALGLIGGGGLLLVGAGIPIIRNLRKYK